MSTAPEALRIDGYHLLQQPPKMGRHGQVYRGVDSASGEAVAIKIFNSPHSDCEEANLAAQKELRALQDLSGIPNIMPLLAFDLLGEERMFYIVTPWVDRSLLDLAAQEPFSSWSDLENRVGRQLRKALRAAHDRNIGHRDFKPDCVRITEDGTPLISDFSISLTSMGQQVQADRSLTLSHLGTFPYTQAFDPLQPRRSDVRGYVVTCLACLAGRDFSQEDPEDLQQLVEKLEEPDSVKEFFSAALFEAESRLPKSFEELEAFVPLDSSRVGEPSTLSVPYHVPRRIREKMAPEFGTADEREFGRRLDLDLNECGVLTLSNWESNDAIATYLMLGSEFSYYARVDSQSKSYFVIVGFARVRRDSGDTRAALGVSKGVVFQAVTESPAAWSSDAVKRIEAEIEHRRANQLAITAEAVSNAVLANWRSMLEFLEAHEEGASSEIRFSQRTLDGHMCQFSVSQSPPLLAEEERWEVLDRDGVTSAVGERVPAASAFVLNIGSVDPDSLPRTGALRRDDRAGRIQRRRQQDALEQIESRSCVRADWVDKITGLSPVQASAEVSVSEFYSADLDDAKQSVVRAALGQGDICVVQGPPGAGKTKLIAEVCAQLLSSDSESQRILVAGQTHNSVDNAFDALMMLGLGDDQLIPVRVGALEKVSKSARPFLLDAMLDGWKAEVEERSERYVQRLADDIGVDADRLRLGLIVERLVRKEAKRVELHQMVEPLREEAQRLHGESKERGRVDPLVSRSITARVRVAEDKEREIRDELATLRADVEALQDQIREDFPGYATELADADVESLRSWMSMLAPEGVADERMLSYIRYRADWLDRFASTSDFRAGMLATANVVFSTCSAVGKAEFGDVAFDVAIIDEASKATPTEVLPVVARSRKLIVVGDDRQLRPFHSSMRITEDDQQQFGLRFDAFQRSFLGYVESLVAPEDVRLLDTQYRMREYIGDLVSECFYGGKLSCGRRDPKRDPGAPPILDGPIVWYDTSALSGRREVRDRKSYRNPSEIGVVERILRRLQLFASQSRTNLSVALLSFYSAQVSSLREMRARIGPELPDLSISMDTVDAFQGREADVAIVSVVRSNEGGHMGHVSSPSRVNVAVSRGRDALVIVGDATCVRGAEPGTGLSDVLNYIETHPARCSLADA